eukprot:g11446.t1
MSSSIHYNAALAQAARTQWFRNRKDIPIGTEAVKRNKTDSAADKQAMREANSLPQVTMDPNEVFAKNGEARIKWIDKCLKLASMGKMNLQDAFYQIVVNRLFTQNCNERQEKAILLKLMRNVNTWEEESRRLKSVKDSSEDSDEEEENESDSSASESAGGARQATASATTGGR